MNRNDFRGCHETPPPPLNAAHATVRETARQSIRAYWSTTQPGRHRGVES